jgi:hypothetical protein
MIPRAICVEHNTVPRRPGSLWNATLRTKHKEFDAARKRNPVKLAAPQTAAAASRPKLSRNVTQASARPSASPPAHRGAFTAGLLHVCIKPECV